MSLFSPPLGKIIRVISKALTINNSWSNSCSLGKYEDSIIKHAYNNFEK